MRTARLRVAFRVLATLLLAWTLADLVGHARCLHDHGPIAPGMPASPGQVASIGAPGDSPIDAGGRDGPEHCLYCGQCAEVQVPFSILAAPGLVSVLVADGQPPPEPTPAPLYHPPLA